MTEAHLAAIMKVELERRFPWLVDDEDANGAETVEALNEWYSDLTEESEIS